jgi:hypothetical protein
MTTCLVYSSFQPGHIHISGRYYAAGNNLGLRLSWLNGPISYVRHCADWTEINHRIRLRSTITFLRKVYFAPINNLICLLAPKILCIDLLHHRIIRVWQDHIERFSMKQKYANTTHKHTISWYSSYKVVITV